MKNEIIDQYNYIGEKIGTVEKEIAHEKGVWHKSEHVWIFNDKNEILLQYRCADKKLYPNTWDVSFAGHISAGESSIDAVIREGKEELGIKVDLNKLNYVFTNREKIKYEQINSKEFVDIYLLRQNIELDKIKFQEEEVSDAKYVSINEFFRLAKENKIMPHESEYAVIEKILKNNFKEV